MHTGSIRNLTDNGTGIDVEHFDLSSVGDIIKSSRGFIDREIVPTALAG